MTTPRYAIRLATPDDAQRICILPEHYLARLDISQRTERWTRNLTEPQKMTFVGVDGDGRVVAFCSVGPNREEPRTFEGEIYAIYLLDEVKRQGLGRALFAEASSWLTQNGLFSIVAWVLRDNSPARRFYERLAYAWRADARSSQVS